MRNLSYQDAEDLLYGCTILGTGGGGDLAAGLRLARDDYQAGRPWSLLDVAEADPDELFACPYFCGAIGEQPDGDRYSQYPKKEELETIRSTRALEAFLGQSMSALVSIEYGGLNTAVALSTAARMGLPCLDADAAGRAVPDLQFSTFYISGRPIAPLAVADAIGDIAIFSEVADDFRAEDLVRALAVVSGNAVGMTDHPIRGRDLADSLIVGALSAAMDCGRARRLAIESGQDPVAAVLTQKQGRLLCRGSVCEDSQYELRGGFTWGSIRIQADEGGEVLVLYKNENFICKQGERSLLSVPDMICVVLENDAYPRTNPYYKKGDRVAVLGFAADPLWRSGKGLEILNPRFFAFDEDASFL